jgi:hypothetical protein
MAIGGTFVRPKPLKVGLVKQLFDRIEELDDDRHVGRLYDTSGTQFPWCCTAARSPPPRRQ